MLRNAAVRGARALNPIISRHIPAHARFSSNWLASKEKTLTAFDVFIARFLNPESCRRKGITPETLFNRAVKCLEKPTWSNTRRAEKAFDRMLNLSPTSAKEAALYENVGDRKKSKKDFGGCLASMWYYSAAYQFGSPTYSLTVKLGHSYFVWGNYRDAIKCFEKAIPFNPENTALYNWLGITYIAGACRNSNSYEAWEASKNSAKSCFSTALDMTYSTTIQENLFVIGHLHRAVYRYFESHADFTSADPDQIVGITKPIIKALEYGKTSTQTDTSTSPAITSSGDAALVMTSTSIEVPNPNNFALLEKIPRKVSFFHNALAEEAYNSRIKAETYLVIQYEMEKINLKEIDTTDNKVAEEKISPALSKDSVKKTVQEEFENDLRHTIRMEAFEFLLNVFNSKKVPDKRSLGYACQIDSKTQGYPVIHALIRQGLAIENHLDRLKELGISIGEIQKSDRFKSATCGAR